MIDIAAVLRVLAQKRPIFHSEADFQHALAWEIHQHWVDWSMRLEFKPPSIKNRIYLDIWASDGTRALAIELKYKTRKTQVAVNGETFDLLNQGAQPLGRYDFLKDVQRLEAVCSTAPNTTAYAIMLTNERLYWTPMKSTTAIDEEFQLAEGRVVTGELAWRSHAAHGTIKNRQQPIVLNGSYPLLWEDYSSLGTERLKYLLVNVGANGHSR